jgi:hypothetical protein
MVVIFYISIDWEYTAFYRHWSCRVLEWVPWSTNRSWSGVATATATYLFFRSFAFIWGATMPSLILYNHINYGLSRVDVSDVRS